MPLLYNNSTQVCQARDVGTYSALGVKEQAANPTPTPPLQKGGEQSGAARLLPSPAGGRGAGVRVIGRRSTLRSGIKAGGSYVLQVLGEPFFSCAAQATLCAAQEKRIFGRLNLLKLHLIPFPEFTVKVMRFQPRPSRYAPRAQSALAAQPHARTRSG